MHLLTRHSPRLLGLVLLLAGMPPASAQEAPSSLDVRLLRGVYETESPAVVSVLHVVDATAFPAFAAAPLAAWSYALAAGDGEARETAYRLTVADGATTLLLVGLKQVIRRPRPYVVLPDVDSRATGRSAVLMERFDPYAFPSGHAALAFATATSWTLSYPRWYVAAPGYLWAAGVAVSRLWLGVHYPSDVLAGALLGAGVALLVHELGPHITPSVFAAEEPGAAGPVVHLRIRLP